MKRNEILGALNNLTFDQSDAVKEFIDHYESKFNKIRYILEQISECEQGQLIQDAIDIAEKCSKDLY